MVQEHFIDEVLLAYQDGELTSEKRARVQAHLDQCWKCRASLASLEQQAHALAELFEDGSFPEPRALVETKLTLQRRVSQYEEALQRQMEMTEPWWHGRRVQIAAFIVLLTLVAGFAIWQHRVPPVVLAAPLLERSISAERLPMRQSNQVVHRTLSLEERVPSSGKVLARRRIEVWEGQPASSAGVKARRIYDEQGHLLSGDWRFRSGSRHLYQRGSKPQKTFLPKEDVLRVPQSMEEAWRLDLCAKDFAALVGNPSRATVKETASAHVVVYDRAEGTEASSSKLIKAWLVLNKSDLRAVEQGLLVEQEKEEHEYRLKELHFDQYPRDMIARTVFQPELELLSPAETTKVNQSSLDQPANPVLAALSDQPPSVNAAFEVNVIYLLGQANMSLGDQAFLQRRADGSLLLNVTVEDEKQMNELLKALAPVLDDPLLRLELKTGSERLAPDVSALSERFPELRQSVLLGQDDSLLNMRIGQTMTRLVDRAGRAKTHAGALQTIGGRFSSDDLERLDEETRDKWLTMLLRHAQALEYETLSLRQELETIFAYPPASVENKQQLVDGNNLLQVIQQLADLGTTHKRIVQAAFDTSAGKKEASAVRGVGFHQSLQTAERLAAAIRVAVAPE